MAKVVQSCYICFWISLSTLIVIESDPSLLKEPARCGCEAYKGGGAKKKLLSCEALDSLHVSTPSVVLSAQAAGRHRSAIHHDAKARVPVGQGVYQRLCDASHFSTYCGVYSPGAGSEATEWQEPFMTTIQII